jgi:hypothetical protein
MKNRDFAGIFEFLYAGKRGRAGAGFCDAIEKGPTVALKTEKGVHCGAPDCVRADKRVVKY